MSIKPKNEEKLTKIYVLKDPDTLEVRYVGKTVDTLIGRLGQHIKESIKRKDSNQTHKTNWINSILESKKIPIIEEVDECPWKESEALEIYYIAKYKSEGYNLVNGTEGGEGVLGRQLEEQSLTKLRNSLRKNLPKVYQYDLDGNLIKEWENAPVAAETLGFKSSGITRCLRGDRFKYKNFIWSTKLSDKANQKLLENVKQRYDRNSSKNRGGYTQSLLAKIISQESKIENTPYYYVYDKSMNLLYEAISANDAASFVNEDLNRDNIDLNSRICSCIKNNTIYYDKYYFSNNPPENYVNTKHKSLLIIRYKEFEFYGITEAANFFKVTKTNVINNIKHITKSLTTKQFGKIQLTYEINKEHGRLYVKTYGLSSDEIEESFKMETSS